MDRLRSLFKKKQPEWTELVPLAPRNHLIAHLNGGQSVLEPKDSVSFDEWGVYAEHHDPAQTETFYPWTGIAWIRSYSAKK